MQPTTEKNKQSSSLENWRIALYYIFNNTEKVC